METKKEMFLRLQKGLTVPLHTHTHWKGRKREREIVVINNYRVLKENRRLEFCWILVACEKAGRRVVCM